ncbi:g7963 [Coccomyxa viridis]|uniref:G7963 protein n=1 Tax=Coccomyxa viridis TaxID=1274662 RepID=A0ABP1FZ78_9CHLO
MTITNGGHSPLTVILLSRKTSALSHSHSAAYDQIVVTTMDFTIDLWSKIMRFITPREVAMACGTSPAFYALRDKAQMPSLLDWLKGFPALPDPPVACADKLMKAGGVQGIVRQATYGVQCRPTQEVCTHNRWTLRKEKEGHRYLSMAEDDGRRAYVWHLWSLIVEAIWRKGQAGSLSSVTEVRRNA